MSLTVEDFKTRFPEFDKAGDARIQLAIDDAALRLQGETWGDLYDMGQAYLAAHTLANSPMGRNAKLVVTKDGGSLYLEEYRKLQKRIVGIGGFPV